MFPIMRPLVVLIGTFVILGCGIIDHNTILRAALERGLHASHPVLVRAREFEGAVVVCSPEKEGNQQGQQAHQIVIIVGDFLKHTEEEGQRVDRKTHDQRVQVHTCPSKVIVD